LRRAKQTLLVAAASLALAACSGSEETPPAPGVTTSGGGGSGQSSAAEARAGDASAGEEIYGNVCATCHGGNPSEDGTVGPAIAGSSLELIEAKVLRGEYPPGYTPKRNSKAMPPLPYLKDFVPDIAAFLQKNNDR
jgi:mono/diheme cytochrome c family protein